MNGRTPTKGERLYIEACIGSVGCVACIIDGREIENPAAWTEFHHDPHFGSSKPDCHYHGFGLCPLHHRGLTAPALRLPVGVAIRHPPSGCRISFAARYGHDPALCVKAWSMLPPGVVSAIGFDMSCGELPPSERGKR